MPTAYLFFAGDGANDPNDLIKMMDYFELGDYRFIMGIRQYVHENIFERLKRTLPNRGLGLYCRLLGGQLFKDLGPLRLIERNLFRQMKLREEVWGWTIEAQLRAAQLNEDILAFSIREKPRLAGFQKVSGVSAWRSAMIGLKIIQAGWRCKKRGLIEKAGN
ncbi:MAG: hypothetical protein P1V20_06620 [Verrucomicrobiales bacterium]|nr:hypothetical protein [Verrucomicrobiales bacterium]